MEASLALFAEVYGRTLLRRRGRTGRGDRALRPQLRQRLLGRSPARLRRRRRPRLHPVHQARRRARSRVRARRHRAHRRPRLPGPVRRAQRVDVRRVRLLPQAAAARPERGPGRLADRRGTLPAVGARPGAALDGRARHRLRRPRPRQGPPGRLDGRLRRDHPGQRRRPPQLRHPQPCLPPRGGGPRRQRLGARRPGLVRRPHLGHRPGRRLRDLRRRDPHRGRGGLGGGPRRGGRGVAHASASPSVPRRPAAARSPGSPFLPGPSCRARPRRARRGDPQRRHRRTRPDRPRSGWARTRDPRSWSGCCAASTCASLHRSRPQPDRYVYTFAVGASEVELGEGDLTPDLAELARLLLDEGTS